MQRPRYRLVALEPVSPPLRAQPSNPKSGTTSVRHLGGFRGGHDLSLVETFRVGFMGGGHYLSFIETFIGIVFYGWAAVLTTVQIGILIIQFLIWRMTKIWGFGFLCILGILGILGIASILNAKLLVVILSDLLPRDFWVTAFFVINVGLIGIICIAPLFAWWSIYRQFKGSWRVASQGSRA
jgi:hypothetical protein